MNRLLNLSDVINKVDRFNKDVGLDLKYYEVYFMTLPISREEMEELYNKEYVAVFMDTELAVFVKKEKVVTSG